MVPTSRLFPDPVVAPPMAKLVPSCEEARKVVLPGLNVCHRSSTATAPLLKRLPTYGPVWIILGAPKKEVSFLDLGQGPGGWQLAGSVMQSAVLLLSLTPKNDLGSPKDSLAFDMDKARYE